MKKIIILLLTLFILTMPVMAQENIKVKPDFPVLKGSYLGQKPPGNTPELFAPGIISTSNHVEFSCTFNPEMTELYFTRVGGSLAYNYTIMLSQLSDGKWSNPLPTQFDTEFLENEPHITPDGSIMYFNSLRPLRGTTGNYYNIWKVKRFKNSWSEPEFFRSGMFLTSASNGNIYYTDISDTTDHGIIVYSIFNNNQYTQACIVGGGVNTRYSEAHPYIAPDESYIILDSDRPGGYTKTDLYICYKLSNNLWSDAINLGEKINAKGNTGFACISPDKKYLFFSLNNDIYWVSAKIIDDLKPKELK